MYELYYLHLLIHHNAQFTAYSRVCFSIPWSKLTIDQANIVQIFFREGIFLMALFKNFKTRIDKEPATIYPLRKFKTSFFNIMWKDM